MGNLELNIPGWLLALSFIIAAVASGFLGYWANFFFGWDKEKGALWVFIAGAASGFTATLALLMVAALAGWHGLH